ncbi:MAG: hypothetical protein IKU40_05775 [Clostridia bacterium]|nr:hypothetical protein [Clostridia bacterium]
MKKLRTYLPLILVLCLVIPLFAACNSSGSGGTADLSAPDSGENLLTNIFAETPSQLPKEARIYDEILPYYDREAGTITEFLLEWEEAVGENGIIGEVYTGWLYTLSEDGELLERTEVPLPENFSFLHSGAVLADAVLYVCASKINPTVVYRYDRATGETTSSGSVEELVGNSGFSPNSFAVDADGRFYGTDRSSVFVLNPDLTLAFMYKFPMTIYKMARGADGRVWTVFNAGMESCAAVIDPETKELGTYYTFTRGIDSGNAPTHYLLASSMNAGESAYNFFYYDMIGALWGVTVTEKGALEETQVFDLFNSGISKLNTGSTFDCELTPIAFLTDELFLTWKYNGQGYANRQDAFVFHRRAADIDMSEMSVITIAYAYPLQASAVEHITEFKRTRPNVSIVLEDYSQYETKENFRAGEEKLCFDLVNGFVKPDIVITDTSITSVSTLSDDNVIAQLYRNNLYVDLVPYLEKDDELNFDNLFGCIRRLFDDGNGGMWGISTDFEADVLLASSALIGKYADKGYWNLAEMLDFIGSLPEDTEKVYNYNRMQIYGMLIAQGYGYFINDNTGSFDSEEFIRYLEFMKTVPADGTEWLQTSPVADIRNIPLTEREDAINKAIGEGRIALLADSLSTMYLASTLFAEETVPIGYATKNDSGFRVRADSTYVITTYAEDADLCFELLKSFFAYEVKYIDTYSFKWPLFARKDHMQTAIKECGETFTIARPLTAEELAELFEIFDTMGSPIIEDTPEDVWNIVNEEMSAFFSGMGTAEDCAKKIQSRVSIWLAEHE